MNLKNIRVTKKEIVGALAVALLFVGAAYFANTYEAQLQNLVQGAGGLTSMIIYVSLVIVSIVFAPVTTLPLLPIAVTIWGSLASALLTILGWVIGSIIAFLLARRYGRPFVAKFINLERAETLTEVALGKNAFVSLLLIRIVMPVELASYAAGLFLDISLPAYTLATVIGVMPFAFVFSYAAGLPLAYQIGGIGLSIIVAGVAFYRITRRINKNQKPKQV